MAIDTPLSVIKMADLDRHFNLWSLFTTAEYQVDERWTASASAGVAHRTPSLTELYAAGPFIGSLQPGLTFVQGDPELDTERATQIDLGLNADYGDTRLSMNGFYSWIKDYIIFDDIGITPTLTGFVPGQQLQQVAFGNTEEAVLAGFEVAGERDLNANLTAFATMSYVEGRDRSRSKPSRIGAKIRSEFNAVLPPPPLGTPISEARSSTPGFDHEPLPGIPPLESIVGIRLHEAGPQPRWVVELSARIVDNQDRVAGTLFEQATPGFTIWNFRSFWRATENLLLTFGVENFTDTFYREHLDFRTGLGVFQPGVNFYFGSELLY